MLAGIAALLAVAEIVVDRAGSALVAFFASSQPALARGLEFGGSGLVGAVAALVVFAAFAVGAASREFRRFEWSILPITAALTVIASIAAGSGALRALHVSVIVGAAVLALAPGPRGFMRAAVVSAGCGIALGQIAFMVPAVGDSTLVRSTAEAALLAAPALAAISFVRGGTTRAVQVAGVVAATLAVGLILARPGVTAMLSTWALGATLSLPLIIYAVAAAGSGMLAVGAITGGKVRWTAAGVILLWTAGPAPTAVHHNLTALLGLFLIAMSSDVSHEAADDQTGVRWQT